MDFELEKSDYFEMDERSRIESLNNHCEEVKNSYTYSIPLSKLEIEKKNSEINQAWQEIKRLKEERSELNKHIAVQNEIIDKNNKEVLQKSQEVTGPIWSIVNISSGYLEKINSEGYIIEKSRIKSGTTMNIFRANDEEKQQKEAI